MNFFQWSHSKDGRDIMRHDTVLNETVFYTRIQNAFIAGTHNATSEELIDNRRVIYKAHQKIGAMKMQIEDMRKKIASLEKVG